MADRIDFANLIWQIADLLRGPISSAANGRTRVRTRGSHRQFTHPVKPGTVTVSGKAVIGVSPGTLNRVLKQAGLKQPERTP